MGTQSAERRASPPYLPFKTFLNFLDMLNATVIPHRIDASIMSKYPGSIKAQLRAGLGYIGAIDDQGIVQAGFKQLVKARGTDTWRDVFSDQFFGWYGNILGDLDIDTATLAQLKDRFRATGVDGSVMIKATRFFLAGLDEAGVTYSPHFKQRGALTGGMGPTRPKRQKATKTRTSENGDEGDQQDVVVPNGFRRLSLPLMKGDNALLVLPEEMLEAEWDMVAAYVRMFFGYDKPKK